MPSLKVTFDTNVLTDVVMPDSCKTAYYAACIAAHRGVKSGRIAGYFGESVVTLDVLGKIDKVAMVGGARISSESPSNGPYRVNLSVRTRWESVRINPISVNLISVAQSLGMRALIGPRYLGNSLPAQRGADLLYENLVFPADIGRANKINEVDLALAQRGLGRSRAVALGVEWSKRDGASGETWMQGLGRARNETERRTVHRAVNEWADGDAIAAHVGYGNDLFCTHDKGRGSGQQSALHPSNRSWLEAVYGVEIVTVSELADRLAPANSFAAP
jgi:hypothetical protein